MVLICVSFDGDITVSCKAPDNLCLQKKEDVLEYIRGKNIHVEDMDEILVVVKDNVSVWAGPF
jgi:hypothetical protein